MPDTGSMDPTRTLSIGIFTAQSTYASPVSVEPCGGLGLALEGRPRFFFGAGPSLPVPSPMAAPTSTGGVSGTGWQISPSPNLHEPL